MCLNLTLAEVKPLSAETSPTPDVPGTAAISAASAPKKPPQAKRVETAIPINTPEPKVAKESTAAWPQLDVAKFFEESRGRLKDAFEKANGQFDNLRGVARETGNVCQEAHVATLAGLKDINEHIFEFTQTEIDRGYDFLRAAADVRGISDLFQLQTDFLRETMETQVEQAKALSELTSNLFKSAFEPLQAGMSSIAEKARKRM